MAFSVSHTILRARGGKTVTQMAYARAEIVTPEMKFVAIRENIDRVSRLKHRGNGDGQSFRQTSIMQKLNP